MKDLIGSPDRQSPEGSGVIYLYNNNNNKAKIRTVTNNAISSLKYIQWRNKRIYSKSKQ